MSRQLSEHCGASLFGRPYGRPRGGIACGGHPIHPGLIDFACAGLSAMTRDCWRWLRDVGAGIDYLPGSLSLGAPVGSGVSAELAADVIWFDTFLTNVDRTPRNPNLLLWHRRLWLIDHGATIYTQHGWSDDLAAIVASAAARFAVIRDHVLLPIAGSIREADARLAPRLSLDLMREAVAAVPDALLDGIPPFPSPERHREAYATHLTGRLAGPRSWVDEAEEARHAGA